MTPKVTYEHELQQAIDAIQYNAVHSDSEVNCRPCAVLAKLRAVMEREGPKAVAKSIGCNTPYQWTSLQTVEPMALPTGTPLYTLPEIKP